MTNQKNGIEIIKHMDKKKKTAVGRALQWLGIQGKAIAPELLKAAGELTGIESLENLGKMISGDKELSQIDKELLLLELEADILEQEGITRRWESDMNSDNKLSKNVRPISLISLTAMLGIFMMLDSAEIVVVKEMWVDLLSTLLVIVFGGYFGARTVEKVMNPKQ